MICMNPLFSNIDNGFSLTLFRWERRIPKSGPGFEAASRHLKSVGVEALARECENLRNSVLDFMMLQAESAGNLMWNQSLTVHPSSFPDGCTLSYNPWGAC